MKNKEIDECSLKELNNFSELSSHLIEFIRENWDADVKPKGYDAYKEDYEEYDDGGEMIPEFGGPLDTSATCDPFPGRMSMPSVAYSDTEQGRDPLNTMVGSILAYGMAIGKQRAKLDNSGDYLIKDIHRLLKRMSREEGISVEEQTEESTYLLRQIEGRFSHIFEEK